MMGQTRLMSLIESVINIGIGYGVALIAQIIVFPWFGIVVSLRDNLLIGACFTVVSIVRSYAVRRVFNWWHLMQFAQGHHVRGVGSR